MSLIAEFTMSAPRLALQPTLEAVADVTVELEGQIATRFHHPQLVVWATGDVGDFDAALEDDPTVGEATVVERLEGTSLYRIELVVDAIQSVYPTYQELGATPLAGTGTSDGWYRRVRFPDRKTLSTFRDFCSDMDISFQLHRLYRPSIDSDDQLGLTDEQHQALQIAFREGYFRVPRDTGLEALGDELDISAQSVSERLRRAIRQVLATTVCRDDREY